MEASKLWFCNRVAGATQAPSWMAPFDVMFHVCDGHSGVGNSDRIESPRVIHPARLLEDEQMDRVNIPRVLCVQMQDVQVLHQLGQP